MPIRVLVFAGSTRSTSLNKRLAVLAAEAAREAGAEVKVENLCDHPLPMYNGDLEAAEGLPPNAKVLKDLLNTHDALIIASPEYNASVTAMLKNVIDWTTRPAPGERPTANYRGKIAAIISASPGPGGGKRGLEHLRTILEAIGAHVIADQLTIPNATAESLQTPSEELRQQLRHVTSRLLAEAAAVHT